MGPDPLLFLPSAGRKPARLHKKWRLETAPRLEAALCGGNTAARSFAAGYLCHLLLDDACHPKIYRYMEREHLSHRGLEIGLDFALLAETGESRFYPLEIQDKKRAGLVASRLLPGVGAGEFHAGLSSMCVIMHQINSAAACYRTKFNENHSRAVENLRHTMAETVTEAAEALLRCALLRGAA
jgi:hypothetical protein